MHRLYLDETGNADLGASDDPNHRYLSLTGVVIHHNHVRDVVTPRINALKQGVFKPDPDEPIILHRKDIMQRNRPFHVLRDPNLANQFDSELLGILNDSVYSVFTVVIDKLDHRTRYKVWRHEPYHFCMEAILERYVLWLRRYDAVGDVMAEQRGGKVDRRLEKSFARHYARGTSFVRPNVMQARLTSKNLKIRPKQKNITGLQIADVLAHPSALYVRSIVQGDVAPTGFAKRIVDILTTEKYDRRFWNNQIRGYGTKWLP